MRDKFYTIIKVGMLMLFVTTIFGFLIVSAQSFSTDSENLKEELLQRGFSDFTRAYHEKVKVFDAWDVVRKAVPKNNLVLSPVIIGIIDTGADLSNGRHPEFVNVNFNGSDPSVFRDSHKGIDIFGNQSGHGTAVAGIIGANNISVTSSANYKFPQMNGIISGVTDKYNLVLTSQGNIRNPGILFRILGFSPFFTTGFEKVLKAMPKNSIVNMSFGGNKCSEVNNSGGCISDRRFEKVIKFYQEGIDGRSDLLFIMSAGNKGIDAKFHLPGGGIDRPNTITVGATKLSDERTNFSNYSDRVNIVAPGEEVYVPAVRGEGNFPADGGDYDPNFSGTSASAPMVTGVAGLISSIRAELTPAEIKQILIETGDSIQTDKPIGPRLNALKAVCDHRVLNCDPPIASTLMLNFATENSASLSWTQNPDPDFSSYKLYRADHENVTHDDFLVTTITVRTLATFTDQNLERNKTYFYKLFTFDQGGLSSSSNEISVLTTPLQGIPVAVAADGTFIALFHADFNRSILKALRFDAQGNQLGAPFTVADYNNIAKPGTYEGFIYSADISYGNGEFLVVWSVGLPLSTPYNPCGNNVGSSFSFDIFGVRMLSDGTILDSVPITISANPWHEIGGVVAFDGSQFIVSWDDTRARAFGFFVCLNNGNSDIFAVPIFTSGIIGQKIHVAGAGENEGFLQSDQDTPLISCENNLQRCLILFKKAPIFGPGAPLIIKGTLIENGEIIQDKKEISFTGDISNTHTRFDNRFFVPLITSQTNFDMFTVRSIDGFATPVLPSLMVMRLSFNGEILRSLSFVDDFANLPLVDVDAAPLANGFRLIWQTWEDLNVGKETAFIVTKIFTAIIDDNYQLISPITELDQAEPEVPIIRTGIPQVIFPKVACGNLSCLMTWSRMIFSGDIRHPVEVLIKFKSDF